MNSVYPRFPPSEVKPFSYEVMYSAVYKCVCRHHSERLYSDLISEADAAFAEMAFDIHDSINLDQETLVGETALCHFDRALRQVDPFREVDEDPLLCGASGRGKGLVECFMVNSRVGEKLLLNCNFCNFRYIYSTSNCN